VEALRALVPIKTATVRPAVTPQGTAYHAEAQKAQSGPLPAATVLYKVMAVREFYDSTGLIVAIGSETGGTGRHYAWVEDWVRMGNG
jgi:hypothetical protein